MTSVGPSKTFDTYLGQLSAVSPSSAPHRFKTSSDRLAYYINAYNAFVIAGVRDLCPVTDLQAVYAGGGFFWRTAFMMGQEPTTLTAIEAERIRGVMVRKPSVHLALVKGAVGYVPLGRKAYEGATLEEQLRALEARALAQPHIVKRDGDTLKVSQIFEWYQVDFGSVENWIKSVDASLLEGQPRLEYVPFNHQLNGTCK